MFLRKFFWKLFLSLLLGVAVSALLFGGLLYRHLHDATLSDLKENLRKEAEMLGAMITSSTDLIQDPRRITQVVPTRDRITIMSIDGTVLADNWAERLGKEAIENHAGRPEFKAALQEKPVYVQRVSVTVEKEMLYYAIPVKANGNPVYVLRLSFALATFYDLMTGIRNFLIMAALITMLLSLPLAYAISRSITGQINRLRDGARRVAAGDLSQKITVQGSQEFQELAVDFNSMADQLRQTIAGIQQEHSRVEALLSKMVEGVLAVDRNGKAVFANAAFCNMMGLKTEKLQGRSFLEITRNDDLSEFISGLVRDTSAKALEAKEIKFFGPLGEKDFSVQASRIQEEGDHVDTVLLVFHDITNIRRVEQVRKDFVANVSHELRTPLTALKGSTELLLDGAYENREECRKFLQIMDKQLQNIHNLVSDMLKLAAAEDTRAPIRRDQVELKPFLFEMVALIEPLIRQKHQKFQVSVPDDPVYMRIDTAQMSDALMNLLDNAIKYTPDGGTVDLKAFIEKESLLIQVADNGPGISPDQIPRIFERFYRADKSRARAMGGTGLGLAIAKHAIESHGGTLQVQSETGKGSTFTIRLPQSAMPQM